MAVIRLRPITVEVHSGATKTGSGAVWADDNPATYTTMSTTSQYVTALYPVDPSVDGATSITFGMTYDLTSLVGGKTVGINASSVTGHVNPSGSGELPGLAVGTGLTVEYTFAESDYTAEATTLAGVVARFVSGPLEVPETAETIPGVLVSMFTGLTVYEQWLDFTLPDVLPIPPVLRQWPRDDARGLSSARRMGAASRSPLLGPRRVGHVP